MTLDEAIKHCEEVANDKAGCCEDCADEHRQFAEWLKQVPRWVSVKDGLPEPCKAVLVYGKVGDMVNWRVDYITECGMWAKSFTVTHWQYLPEPPKE